MTFSGCAASEKRKSTADQRTAPEIIAATALRSTVLVRTQLGQGTGFAVDPGMIVTSFHVVAGESVISIRDAAGVEHPVVGMRSYDETNDLAILHAPSASMPPLRLGSPAAPPIGSPVVVVSNPLGYQGSITTGVVSALRTEGVQLDAAIAPGSSGAPVIDRGGFVIGVMRQTRADAQNLNFAVPVAFLRRLLAYTTVAVTPLATFAETTRKSRTRVGVECSLFTEIVNQSLFAITQISHSISTQPDISIRQMHYVARAYDQLRSRIQAVRVVSDLTRFVQEYQAMCVRAATAARGVATAIQTDDADKAQAAAKEFDAIEQHEDRLVDAINSFCKL